MTQERKGWSSFAGLNQAVRTQSKNVKSEDQKGGDPLYHTK